MTAGTEAPRADRRPRLELLLRVAAASAMLALTGACGAFGGESFSGIPLPVVIDPEPLPEGLERLDVVVSAIELVPCDASPGLASRLGALLIPAAAAHTGSTPTRIGVPSLLRFGDEGPIDAGSLEPPTGCYVGVRLLFAPADPDVRGLAAVPDVEGFSLVARTSGGSDVHTSRRSEVEVWWEAPEVLAASDRPLLRVRVRSGTVVTASWGADQIDSAAAGELLGGLEVSATLAR